MRRKKASSFQYAIFAIHGGKIQPETTEVAEVLAGEKHSFYTFEGLKPGYNYPLYVPSHLFDEPHALELAGKVDTVISINGCKGEDSFIRLGGLDKVLQKNMRQQLLSAGFQVSETAPEGHRGLDPNNICNRGKSGQGVQIELSRGLRDRLPTEDDIFEQLVRALNRPLEHEFDEPLRRVDKPSSTVDVLVITSAPGEQDALFKCIDSYKESQYEASRQWECKQLDDDTYYCRYFTCESGERIKVASLDTLDQGMNQAAIYASIFIKQLKPKCVAIVGICAGDQEQVYLGDIIVAEKLFHVRRFGDNKTYNLTSSWLRKIKVYDTENDYLEWQSNLCMTRPIGYKYQSYWLLHTLLMHEKNAQENPHPANHPDRDKRCPNYRAVVNYLKSDKWVAWEESQLRLKQEGRNVIKRELALERNSIADILRQERSYPRVFIRPVGTGVDLVEEENFFRKMREEQRQHYVAAYDMEGYAVAEAAWTGNITKMIFVKSVSDFAGSKRRDGHFREYACSASATFLIHFLKHNFSAD
ncbi:poly-gamma-glutamate hydrolase family protein [Leptolyngbya ectocarpi]|uniref:poly-gamma-glutamate hydrolase family protein n=1 Tax=Leptolyngbya ectocarpi TaxID=1202 RepID=UPI00223ED053|nr:poly-gamma-glutamate hydrolase family protein [Leptolyngbya ectocarpi]